jgi:hypothetical protein
MAKAVVQIEEWDEGFVWNAWGVQPKTHLVDLLTPVCPGMHKTEIKRLARSVLKHECKTFQLENSCNADSIVSFLQVLGAEATLIAYDPAPGPRAHGRH